MTDCFILGLLAFMWMYDYPRDLPLKRLIDRVSRLFVWLGLWHGWAMFAPEPIHVNRQLRAIIRFQDGSEEEWCPFEPRTSGRLLDMLFLRSHKYQHSVLSGQNPALHQPLCEFLAQQATGEERRVQTISLVRDYRMVNPPDSETPYGERKRVAFFAWQAPGDVETALTNFVKVVVP